MSDDVFKTIITALAGIITAVLVPGVPVIIGKLTSVHTKIDGLLEKKAIADEAIGAEKQKVVAAKEKAASDSGELKAMKDQALKDTPPK